MNQVNKRYIVLGVALLGILVVLFFLLPSGEVKAPEKKKEKKKNEKKVIIKKPINPKGTFLLYQLMRTYEKTVSLDRIQTSYQKNLRTSLPKTNKNGYPNVYLAITDDWQLNYEDYEYLTEFVEDGNYAFISAENFMYDIKSEISYFTSDILKYYYDTTIIANFYHPDLKQNHFLEVKNADLNLHGFPRYKNWAYIASSSLKNDAVKIIYNSSEEYPIAVMMDVGKGKIIIHTVPDAFSNTNVLLDDGKKHAELAFSHLPKSNIYWHNDFGEYSPYRGNTQPQEADPYEEEPEYPKSSPLQYILREPVLLAAFVLLVVGVLLYMLVQSKRRQRIIPAIESNKNTSLEFVDTVSKLYFQQHRHDKLIAHLEQLFLAYIRHHYYLTSPKVDEVFVRRVSEKSGISEQRIASIFKGLKLGKKNKATTEADLVDIYNKLNYFYKNCN